jgi:hypothetical protein
MAISPYLVYGLVHAQGGRDPARDEGVQERRGFCRQTGPGSSSRQQSWEWQQPRARHFSTRLSPKEAKTILAGSHLNYSIHFDRAVSIARVDCLGRPAKNGRSDRRRDGCSTWIQSEGSADRASHSICHRMLAATSIALWRIPPFHSTQLRNTDFRAAFSRCLRTSQTQSSCRRSASRLRMRLQSARVDADRIRGIGRRWRGWREFLKSKPIQSGSLS